MKSFRTALISLALLAGCSTQTGIAKNSTDDPAAKVTAAGAAGSCCGDAGTTGEGCCDAPTKAQALAEKAEQKVEAASPGCCGACAPEAEAKQP